MSLIGLTKGTDFEEKIEQFKKGEEQGAVLYAAAALIAKEKGLNEVAETLMKIAVDELRHAALYTVLNGHANEDIFETMRKIQPLESSAEVRLKEFAQALLTIQPEITKAIEAVAEEETTHGERLNYLLDKFQK